MSPPNPFQPSNNPPPLLLALSGPTSSGKTTIATALASILPNHLAIHADDFYKPDSEIPTKDGVQDWDCAGSLDLEKFRDVLVKVKEGREEGLGGLVHQGNFEGGVVMDGVHGVKGIEDGVVARLRAEVEGWPEDRRARKIIIVDGFLLFGRSVREQLAEFFDLKVLLRARYEDAKRRREGRNGYVTLEGFWEDPPGYFDKIVWANYVKEHEFVFEEFEDGSGLTKEGVCMSGDDWSLEKSLEWVVGALKEELESAEGEGK